MAKPKTGKVPMCIMMTDKEFQEYHENIRKEKLLKDMFAAANQPFTVKNVSKPKETKKEKPNKSEPIGEYQSPSIITQEKTSGISDDEWEEIIQKASNFNPSPIEEITRTEMGEFSLDDIGIKDEESTYQTMFKKEQAMLAELLKDVSKHAKAAGSKLEDMTKKSAGYGGVSKTYADLVSATNALNSTRLSIVKEMAALKKTIADLEMKRIKEVGDTTSISNDDVANDFYSQIISNRKQFIDESMNMYYGGGQKNDNTQQLDYVQPEQGQSYLPDNMDIANEMYNQSSHKPTRSITSSLRNDDYDYDRESSTNADPYGYIRNEKNGISICVERYEDGRLNFVAVDNNGDGVDDYELPGEDLLMDLEITPMSKWASDSTGRRYRIIDVDSNGVDISDILEDDE